MVRYLNVTALCMHVLSAACVAAEGLAGCTRRAVAGLELAVWDRYDMAAAAAPPPALPLPGTVGVVGGASDAHTLRLLGIVLPTAMLGG